MTKEQYTAAVDYLVNYVEQTEPIFSIAKDPQGRFKEVQGKLEFALNTLKEQPDYTGDKIRLN